MLVFFVGVMLGLLVVSFILNRRAARESARSDPWREENARAAEAGADPLPEEAPEVFQKGRIVDFGHLPESGDPSERVWLLQFDDSYPFVRVVEDLDSGAFRYMAADQIVLKLPEDGDVTALQPMLNALDLRLRMFNRRENIAVVGVLSRRIDAIPRTLEALEPWSELFVEARPDWIRLRETNE
ncbi:MAG: hypothetical protein ACLFUF_03275 [Opitutales bacterium]